MGSPLEYSGQSGVVQRPLSEMISWHLTRRLHAKSDEIRLRNKAWKIIIEGSQAKLGRLKAGLKRPILFLDLDLPIRQPLRGNNMAVSSKQWIALQHLIQLAEIVERYPKEIF